MITALVHGIILAFGLILPLGVQNIFIFNQGVQQLNIWRCMPSVITAGLCDTLLIILAVSGVSALVSTIHALKLIVMTAGILFLLYMGWNIWSSKTHIQESVLTMTSKKQIMFAASVSLLNPHAILDTVGVIGTNSLAYSGVDKLVFTLSCISVSWIWFIGLALAGRIVGKVNASGYIQQLINKGSAIIIWLIALYLASTLLL
ncbi:LysE/ArgO family amino acid transporter [Fictibacillus phosphorivorans]|uniref:LysE/ArgO family amino acid transporter n=1 Tax=Fictibacillus phosphorivorans TaxID=1221500 RepID=UPI00204186B0|nr:LysE/ArgO family amino acid transporter [Fictibacillus phosphorivorans]MCM3718853.1 LysE/ArgO family amino acid transporter [Fictibacillus phosphorivorans]MCM3776475.1 LysE/ArgO family amino acid transporter [Fictibacillus phosphorivorans]